MQHGRYPEVPSDFGHWLAGFIDGEGSFVIGRADYGQRRGQGARPSYRVWFTLSLRQDDLPILEEIHRRTGVGRVYRRNRKPHPTRPNGKPQAEWQVFHKRDLSRLVALLDAFPLRAKKARDYAIWREAALLWVPMLSGGRPGRRGQKGGVAYDWSRFTALADALKAGRTYDAALVQIPEAVISEQRRLFES